MRWSSSGFSTGDRDNGFFSGGFAGLGITHHRPPFFHQLAVPLPHHQTPGQFDQRRAQTHIAVFGDRQQMMALATGTDPATQAGVIVWCFLLAACSARTSEIMLLSCFISLVGVAPLCSPANNSCHLHTLREFQCVVSGGSVVIRASVWSAVTGGERG